MPVSRPYGEGVRRMVEAVHHYGLRIYPYAIHERFPLTVPEFDLHGRHIAQYPLRSFQYGGSGRRGWGVHDDAPISIFAVQWS